MQNKRILFLAFALTLFISSSGYSSQAKAFQMDPIPGVLEGEIDPIILKRIEFWVKVYSFYSSQQGIIHDAGNPEIILEVINLEGDQSSFDSSSGNSKKAKENKVNKIKKFYRDVLMSIHTKMKKSGFQKSELNAVETRVFDLYSSVDEPDKFFRAAHNKRIRMQLGQRDRFEQGLYYSGRFLPIMEKIFKAHGIPTAITRLPFVESTFNLRARSKVGASGIWQFMRSTGKFFLRINDTIDERNDPIRATEGAAQLLKMNFESLQQWPLAITAYNHGRIGMMRAVRKVGSASLSDIIRNYQSRSFGFASSNFFCEFAAAYEVERNVKKYFGTVEREPEIEFTEFTMQDYISPQDVSTYSKIPSDTLFEFNPALTDLVWKGQRMIPAGYVLRLPKGPDSGFKDRYKEIPLHKKFASQHQAR